MSQAQLPALPRVEIIHVLALEGQFLQQLFPTRHAQTLNQLGIHVKVVLDGRLARARNEQLPAYARKGQLLEHILHHRLAPHRQHFFRLTLG